jgi:hypothetical protein
VVCDYEQSRLDVSKVEAGTWGVGEQFGIRVALVGLTGDGATLLDGVAVMGSRITLVS